MSLSTEPGKSNLNLYIFPCFGKRPVFGFKWKESSTDDPLRILRLRRKYPTAVWAVDLEKSGLICIDCDKDGDNVGLEWLTARCPETLRGALLAVPGCWSPTGGRHFYFRNTHPPFGDGRGDMPPKHTANIDVKGKGYVLLPGSDTSKSVSDGGVYVPIGDLAEAPPLPDWLVGVLGKPERSPSTAEGAQVVDLVPESRGTPWGKAALEAICAELAAVPAGSRSNEAARLAFKLGQILEQARISPDEAYAQLEAVALSWRNPAIDKSDKALGPKGTLTRGLEAGTKSPRGPDTKDEDGPEINFGSSKAREEERKEEGPKAEPARSRWLWHGEEDVEAVHAWLVDKLLPETGIVILAGQPKKGKSIIALDICGSVMAASAFLDHEITRPGGVLFLALPTEGVKEVPIRLRGLVKDKLAKQGLSEKFLDKLPIAWLRDGENAFNLQKQNDVNRLVADLEAAAAKMYKVYGVPPVLVVVDTMEAAAKFSKGYPANEAKRVAETLAAIGQRFKVCILVIDHLGKDEDQGPLGSIAKEGGADVVLSVRGKTFAVHSSRLTKSGKETARRFSLESVKLDDGGNETFVVRWKPKKESEEPDVGDDDSTIGDFVAAGKAKRNAEDRWSRHLRVFRRIMKKVMQESGVERRPAGDMPLVRSVASEAVRNQFLKDKLGDGADRTSMRKAFRRALDGVDAEGLVLKFNVDENEYLYFAHKDDEK